MHLKDLEKLSLYGPRRFMGGRIYNFTQGYENYKKKIQSQVKILGTVTVTLSKCYNVEPQILRAKVQYKL